MESLLKPCKNLTQSPFQQLDELITQLRPPKASDGEVATKAIYALCYLLSQDKDLRAHLRASLLFLFDDMEQVSMYVSTGILPNTGFFSEAERRIFHKLLPEVVDPLRLKDTLSQIFHKPSDEIWVNLVSNACWNDLLQALRFDEEVQRDKISSGVLQIIKATRILSYHISAIGFEPELIRLEPSIEKFESPFLSQNIEALIYLTQIEQHWLESEMPGEDDKHLLVLLDQCDKLINRMHRHATIEGTSIRLTFVLKRLHQHLERLSAMLALLNALRSHRSGENEYTVAITLFKTLVQAECRKNDLGDHWNQSMGLLALRVTESASRAGEHYIAETRSEYFEMWRSAAGAGIIVACLSMSKLAILKLIMPPLSQELLVCLNYGFGFMFIHFLHFTVATKQPAMTAATLAASIGEGKGQQIDVDNLTGLIVRMIRSQIAAILGNVGTAIPMSIVIGLAILFLTGKQFISMDSANQLVQAVNPIHSGSLFYAAIAGVCLFLSGLIAGYYDNLGAYNKIPQRLMQLKWIRRILGEVRQRRMVSYIERNLGALVGNFFFGCMLGGVTAAGVLLGLPLDIRHIAFSSAFMGYALVGLNFHMGWDTIAWSAAGIALIGLINLVVSFALALAIALRARQVSFDQWRRLVSSVLRQFIGHPSAFFFPPKSGTET